MAGIVWTREALASLELIRAYIHQFNPSAARRLAGRLIELGDSLRHFPERGRPIGQGRRELVAIRPYVLRYRYERGAVFILGIRHMARDDDANAS